MLNFELPLEDVEYLLDVLDECPHDSREYSIREEILLQAYA
mgnify:FL=1